LRKHNYGVNRAGKAILRLKADGVSDYKIARKLKMETPNVTRSRKNALKKIELARADLDFIKGFNRN